MDKPKGGRGKKADYESTHVRIPEPLKLRVEELKRMWFEGQLDFHDECIARDARLAREYENLLTGKENEHDSESNPLPSLETAIEESRKILKSKKSARESLAKLLTALYGVEVSKENL